MPHPKFLDERNMIRCKQHAVLIMTLALFIIELVGDASTKTVKLLPVDEGPKDSSFKRFRDQLLQAARNHDRKFLLSVLSPEIQVSFGDDPGVENFIQYWRLDQPNSALWDELTTLLSLGGAFLQKDAFDAPYVSALWPPDVDPFEHAAIIGKDVKLRREANSASPVVTTLSYDIVKVDYERSVRDKTREGHYSWVKVRTPSGTEGYVAGKYIRNAVDYRARFEKKGGRWLMTYLLAGD